MKYYNSNNDYNSNLIEKEQEKGLKLKINK